MINLKGIVVMSDTAYNSLSESQIAMIECNNKILHSNL